MNQDANVPPVEVIAEKPQTYGLATASLVLGILGFFCIGLLGAIPAIVCGHMAVSRIGKSAGKLAGNGLAVAGLVLGYVWLAFGLLILPALLIPAVAKAKEKAVQTRTINNLRQIHLSIYRTSLENPSGKLPASLAELASVDNLPPVLFDAPGGSDIGAIEDVDTWSDVVYVSGTGPDSPSDTVMLYTKPGCFRGKGGVVVYASGASVWLDEPQFSQTIP